MLDVWKDHIAAPQAQAGQRLAWAHHEYYVSVIE
jgi:hypothetical protein